MAHELEMNADGTASMAYVGEVPWHGLGKRVPADLTPAQMCEAAGADWTVETVPLTADFNGAQVETGHSALIRSSDSKVLDVITDDWHPLQNEEAFDFFNRFVQAGEMEMHTAGVLKDGRMVWALAKIVGEAFEAVPGDPVEGFLLFSNPHQYGRSIDVRTTMTRVVCNNTLTLALNSQSKKIAKVSHRRAFDAEQVLETIGVAKHKLEAYKERAQFLTTKRYTGESMEEYFKGVFPRLTTKTDPKAAAEALEQLSSNAQRAIEIINTDDQPGAEFGKGSMWELFNAATYMFDHEIGRSVDARLTSAWYGANLGKKQTALNLAVEMAEVA